MITRKEVRALVDQVEQVFVDCWATLALMRTRLPESDAAGRLLRFQPDLAEAIHRLRSLQRDIRGHERSLIGRKKQLDSAWFEKTMARYREFREILDEAVRLAISLGNAFAWLFFAQDREKLTEHEGLPPVHDAAQGVGWRGEVEFLRRTQLTDGKLVIYHGTTSFLRAGDVSFVDLKKRTVAAIAELKSKKVGPNQVEVTAHFIGPELPGFFPSIESAEPDQSATALPQQLQAKLNRQLPKITKIFKEAKTDQQAPINDGYHVEEFRAFATNTGTPGTTYQQVGDGLLMVGFWNHWSRSLWNRLAGSKAKAIARAVTGVSDHAARVVDTTSGNNSFVLGDLRPGRLLPGGTPLFWWPVDNLDFLRAIYFHELIVVTMFNPAHLVAKLAAQGFEVEVDRGHLVRAEKDLEDGRLVMDNLTHYQHAITHHLSREEAVVEAIDRSAQIAVEKQRELGPGSQIRLTTVMNHHLIV